MSKKKTISADNKQKESEELHRDGNIYKKEQRKQNNIVWSQ